MRQFLPVLALVLASSTAFAAGDFVPESGQPLTLTDHTVNVVLNNGFARTEVVQTWDNPNNGGVEAIYRFPLPRDAALSEMVVNVGENTVRGEVVGNQKAKELYDDAKAKGEDAALATKEGYQGFEFSVANIPGGEDAVVRFVYYQPLEIDTGVGRWTYPLEAGGNDEGTNFWDNTIEPAGDLNVNIELKSAFPVDQVRMPGWQNASTVSKLDDGHYKVSATLVDDTMDQDLVFYYRLTDELPGRAELITYKPEEGPGTFMLVVTPGVDLAPVEAGADYVFLLDRSGSMQGTMNTLIDAVARSIPELRPEDRFRIVAFSDRPEEIVGWTQATEEGVQGAIQTIRNLKPGGGTNMYAGLTEALKGLDADRPASLIIVTDAVANQGEVRPERFYELMAKQDLRVFSFLLGNGGNWPLMDVISDASGGHSKGISNADDILGQIKLARSKMGYQAMHGATLSVRGTDTWGLTDEYLGKVFRGEQLVVFGRYNKAGQAEVFLDAKISGSDKTYKTTLELPATSLDNPELERLWALQSIKQAQLARDRGEQPGSETASAIRKLGEQYQLVTDETSMIALTDEAFEREGIGRKNRDRTANEHAAQDRRAGQAAQNHTTRQPMFKGKAPRLPSGGGGGGAIDPLSGGIALGLGALALYRRRKEQE